MKYFKGFLACFLAVLMAVPSFAVSNNRQANEDASITEYQLLMSSFEEQKRENKTNKEYPDYYAGAYIADSGKLVVLVTDTSVATEREIAEITKNPSIDVRYAAVSMNELREQQMIIAERMQELIGLVAEDSAVVTVGIHDIVDAFLGIGIDEAENTLVVDLANDDEETIDAFKRHVSNYKNVIFIANSKDVLQDGFLSENTIKDRGTSAVINPGDLLDINSYYGSVGYRCYRDSNGVRQYGFVTAAHCMLDAGGVLNETDDMYVGVFRAYQYSGTVDAAFVEVKSGYSVGTTAGGDTISGAWMTSMPTGMTVYMRGQSTGITLTGQLRGNSYICVTRTGIILTDMLRTEFNWTPREGDSGGIVYCYSNSVYCVMGVHHGERNGYGIASKAQNVYTSMGVVPY